MTSAVTTCPYQLLEEGSVNLTTVTLLAPHLTAENHSDVPRAAIHVRRRDVERQVAALHPLPPVATRSRRLPTPPAAPPVAPSPPPVTAATAADMAATQTDRDVVVAIGALAQDVAPARQLVRPAVIAPLSPECYKVQLTITRETHDKLRRLQDLMRHSVANGDPAVIFDRALSALLSTLEKRKLAGPTRDRGAGRASTRAMCQRR